MPSPFESTDEEINRAAQQQQIQKAVEERKIADFKRLQPNIPPDEFAYIQEQEKAWNDTDLNFNENMERSIEDKFPTGFLGGDMMDATIEKGGIKTSQIASISSDKILQAISETIRKTGALAAAYNNLANNDGVVLFMHLTDNSSPNTIAFAIAEVTAYQTSVAAANIIPYGASALHDNYRVYYAADKAVSDATASGSASPNPGVTMSYCQVIYNQSGSTQNIVWRLRWRYLGRPLTAS